MRRLNHTPNAEFTFAKNKLLDYEWETRARAQWEMLKFACSGFRRGCTYLISWGYYGILVAMNLLGSSNLH